jgi:predicted TIM-barrel fold metal-dependent hydrolase
MSSGERRAEAAPVIAFTDTHVHFWDLRHPDLTYEWLAPEALDKDVGGDHSAIKSVRYLPEDLVGETRFHGVRHVIHVEAARGRHDSTAETRWVQALAERDGMPAGIVAHVDLAGEDIAGELERHSRFRNLRGIRPSRPQGYLFDPRWRRGYSLLERFGLVCCTTPAPHDVAATIELVETVPGVTYCVNHAGSPRRRDREYFEGWRERMRKLAGPESTVIKISGLGMADHRWTIESLRPWVSACIECWGPSRVMFGSNWPVDRLFSSYGDLVGAYRELVSECARDEQEAMLFRNADRIFRLDDPSRSPAAT